MAEVLTAAAIYCYFLEIQRVKWVVLTNIKFLCKGTIEKIVLIDRKINALFGNRTLVATFIKGDIYKLTFRDFSDVQRDEIFNPDFNAYADRGITNCN